MRLLPPARVVVAVLACGLLLGLVAAPEGSSRPPSRAELNLVAAINDARSAHGLKRVRMVWPLQRHAQEYARTLMRRDRFEHAYLPAGVRENLAIGMRNRMGAKAVVRRWLNSPVHREALLWRHARAVGAGVANGRWRGYSGVRITVARFR